MPVRFPSLSNIADEINLCREEVCLWLTGQEVQVGNSVFRPPVRWYSSRGARPLTSGPGTPSEKQQAAKAEVPQPLRGLIPNHGKGQCGGSAGKGHCYQD